MENLKKLTAISLVTFLCLSASATTLYVDVNSPAPTLPYADWSTAATNIQDAIDAAANGDTVLVTNGVYATGGRPDSLFALTNRVLINKPVTVQSVNGPTVTVIEGQQVPGTITGDGAVRGVFLGIGATLSGFTVTNGATRGANGDPKGEQVGGGVYSPSLASMISNCVLIGNAAYSWGGGATEASLYRCVLQNNSARTGGGTYLSKLYNCVVISNTASATGGGAARGTLNNCTVVGNSAGTNGGGFDGSSDGKLNNCVLYFNSAPMNANWYRGTFNPSNSVNYCCTVPYSSLGYGNITNDPALVDLSTGDYHLQSNSPCINSGWNAYATNTPDLDGNARIVGGTVDIGAYEIQSPASQISYAWLQQYGLTNDGSVDLVDSDGDLLNNWQEWRAGTDPTDSSSVLMLLSPSNSAPGVVVINWQSVSGKLYSIDRAADLTASPSFQPLASNIVGQVGWTSFADTNAAGGERFFYRVGVQ